MPPRGQKLFVRPMTPEDLPDLRRLKNAPDLPLPQQGVVGRLVGQTVSFAAISLSGDGQLRIEELFVAAPLRRKRIGRAVLHELLELAVRLNCSEIVVSHRCEARQFFLHAGFAEKDSILRKSL